MTWNEAFEEIGQVIAHRHELLAAGASVRSLTSAVRSGYLIRVRRDHYALPGTCVDIVRAVRVGGQIACVSALRAGGVFAVDPRFPHVHLRQNASRLRSPRDRFLPLSRTNRDGVELHWRGLAEPETGRHSVGIVDALIQSLWCQHPWHSLASLDNALHEGLIDDGDITGIFRNGPVTLAPLRGYVDRRKESGQESVLGSILREAKLDAEPQVPIPGVGRVDFVVAGCLVVEADSRLAHDGWELHVRDRNRDLDLARQGYMSLRPVYNRIMFTPDDVRDAILGLLRARVLTRPLPPYRARNSG